MPQARFLCILSKQYLIILGGFATSADPVKELPGTSGEAVWEVRESPGELSQGSPGRGGGELSGGVPGSSPWDLGGGGLGAPRESQTELSGEWPNACPHADPPLQPKPESGRNLAGIWPQTC